MTPTSDTPRTDQQINISISPKDIADFARQLERELNAANERIKKLIEAGDLLESRTCRYGFKEWKEAKR